MFFKRIAETSLKRYLNAFPAVGLTGPRQSGKSTLLQQALPDYEYVNFDYEKNILSFENDPEGFVAQYSKNVIFDEAQFVPKLFNVVKTYIDKNRLDYGRFILTGSSQFYLLKNISESLAGRIGLMSLLPLQYREMPKALLNESIFQGSYPELVLRSYQESECWYSSYIDTYLSKDLNQMINIDDRRSFRQLIQLLAANISKPLNMNEYSKSLGVSLPTIKRWISALEASYIIYLLPPFYENYGKRIIKSPKLYFYDTGLVSYLTGINSFEMYNKGPLAGHLFENYIVSEIVKKELHNASLAELYYFRTQDGMEIDLIIDRKQCRECIKIKKSASFTPRMASALKKYTRDTDKKFILYNGDSYTHADITVQHYGQYLSDNVQL